jgi:hypothetical protein
MKHRMAPDLAPERAWFKSSYSSENGTHCVEIAWFKSSHSQENGTACVEVGPIPATGHVAIRDSKDKAGPALLFPAEAFAAFVSAVREGRLPA